MTERGAFGAVDRVVMLDRDGTINVERNYLSDPAELELLPGAAEGIRSLRGAGLGVAVVTNQSGLARGYFDSATLDRIHARLNGLLLEGGASVDEIYVCPHGPWEGCRCRKPGPGLAEQVAAATGADLSRCFVVGDKECDIELGRGVGATTILVLTGYGAKELQAGSARPHHVAADLREAATIILRIVEMDGAVQPGPASGELAPRAPSGRT